MPTQSCEMVCRSQLVGERGFGVCQMFRLANKFAPTEGARGLPNLTHEGANALQDDAQRCSQLGQFARWRVVSDLEGGLTA